MNWAAFWTGFKRGLMLRGLGEIWCGLTHGGGRIKRDEQGRINWQCDKCGRWSRYPVTHQEESSMTNAAIDAMKEQQP